MVIGCWIYWRKEGNFLGENFTYHREWSHILNSQHTSRLSHTGEFSGCPLWVPLCEKTDHGIGLHQFRNLFNQEQVLACSDKPVSPAFLWLDPYLMANNPHWGLDQQTTLSKVRGTSPWNLWNHHSAMFFLMNLQSRIFVIMNERCKLLFLYVIIYAVGI